MNLYVLVSCERRCPGKITAAGLFLFRKCSINYEYLLLKTTSKRDKYWTPPKGQLIRHKTFLESAKITTNFLTGYTCSDYNVFEQYKHVLKYSNDAGSQKEIMYYLTELSNNNKPLVLQPRYHSCFAWATFEDACRLLGYLEQKRMLRFFHDTIHDKTFK